ncbi:MAG: hypothetical protein JWQ07_1461 [Ramlibacter sp.]|nr:hypothetical protein [Ramlibacter sp.]
MSVPLATLRRHSQLVWLHDPMDLPPAAPLPKPGATFTAMTPLDVTHGRRVAFWHAEDAQAWLCFWKSDVGAVMALRGALQKGEPSAPVFSWTDDQVLAKLGARLARGAVVAIESARPSMPAVLPLAPAPPAVVEPPAVPVAQILAGIPVPPPPLLPLLEELQIEGAEVLPEIEQSLAQVDITIGELKVAPVSLEPTPSKVPGIETAMTEAGASVTATLDKL